jgi:hypothetical protein
MLVRKQVAGRAFLARDGKSILELQGTGPYRIREIFFEDPSKLPFIEDPGDVNLETEEECQQSN